MSIYAPGLVDDTSSVKSDDFYMRICSKPTDNAPTNRVDCFTDYMPCTIRLSSDYEVAVERISLPLTWNTFSERTGRELWLRYRYTEIVFEEVEDSRDYAANRSYTEGSVSKGISPWKKVDFPQGCYTTPNDFLQTLSHHIGGNRYDDGYINSSNAFCFYYIPYTNRVYIQIFKHSIEIEFSKKAGRLLGFEEESLADEDSESAPDGNLLSGDRGGEKPPPDKVRRFLLAESTYKSMITPTLPSLVYKSFILKLDIIKKQYFEGGYEEFLSAVDISETTQGCTNTSVIFTPDRRCYKKLKTRDIQSLRFDLLDARFHKSPDFIPYSKRKRRQAVTHEEYMHVDLHFRPISFIDGE